MDRPAGGAADQIVQRDLDGRLGAGIAVEPRLHRRRGAGEIVGGALEQAGRHQLHRGHHAGDGFAGHGRRRRRLAPTDDTVVGLDADEDIIGPRDGLAGHLHRLLHRQTDRDGLDRFDLHANLAHMPRIQSRPCDGTAGGDRRIVAAWAQWRQAGGGHCVGSAMSITEPPRSLRSRRVAPQDAGMCQENGRCEQDLS